MVRHKTIVYLGCGTEMEKGNGRKDESTGGRTRGAGLLSTDLVLPESIDVYLVLLTADIIYFTIIKLCFPLFQVGGIEANNELSFQVLSTKVLDFFQH